MCDLQAESDQNQYLLHPPSFAGFNRYMRSLCLSREISSEVKSRIPIMDKHILSSRSRKDIFFGVIQTSWGFPPRTNLAFCTTAGSYSSEWSIGVLFESRHDIETTMSGVCCALMLQALSVYFISNWLKSCIARPLTNDARGL